MRLRSHFITVAQGSISIADLMEAVHDLKRGNLYLRLSDIILFSLEMSFPLPLQPILICFLSPSRLVYPY